MQVDPIDLELMRNLFEAAAEEMGLTLQRVAFSANIKERRDFSCALFDSTGELLAQAAHIPVHLGSMPASVRAVLERLGTLEEGDVAIVNDPFAGGTHLPDITIVSPIIHGGKAVGYAANRAHHADVGGVSPGSMTLSRHIDEEGIRIEPALLYRRGARVEELFDRIVRAVRTPDERVGDLEAQLAANHVGATAMLRMIDRHGVDVVIQYGRALLDYAQSFMAAAIAAIPDGEYRFEDVMDDDGAVSWHGLPAREEGHAMDDDVAGGRGPARGWSLSISSPSTRAGSPCHEGGVPIRVVVRIAGDRAVVDLTASADQVAGCINCPQAVARSAAYYCFACLLDERVALNGGSFRNIDVITRPGSVVHALYPAAVVAGNTETSQRIVDVVFGALAQALPGKIPAASCGTMSSVALGGDGWTYYETIGGGSGAGPEFDGASCVQCHMTNTLNTPAEALELQYPLRVRQFERAIGTGGEGKHRGGDGIFRSIEVLADCSGTLLADRRRTRPYGLAGGGPGAVGEDSVTSAGKRVLLPSGKTQFELRRGDVLTIRTPGGGGCELAKA